MNVFPIFFVTFFQTMIKRNHYWNIKSICRFLWNSLAVSHSSKSNWGIARNRSLTIFLHFPITGPYILSIDCRNPQTRVQWGEARRRPDWGLANHRHWPRIREASKQASILHFFPLDFFLPRILHTPVLNDILSNGPLLFLPHRITGIEAELFRVLLPFVDVECNKVADWLHWSTSTTASPSSSSSSSSCACSTGKENSTAAV